MATKQRFFLVICAYLCYICECINTSTVPTVLPTIEPTIEPTQVPTISPTIEPTMHPISNVITSHCLFQKVISGHIQLHTISDDQYVIFKAISCMATNWAPTLTLSHYEASWGSPSLVYSFDTWTPNGGHSIVLNYHDGGNINIGECISCYPSSQNVTIWISWKNKIEISLGFGSKINQHTAITTNYSKYYNDLSIQYVSIWSQVGDCIYLFYDDCPEEPTMKPTMTPSFYDINVNQEPTSEPTIEPTTEIIIKYIPSKDSNNQWTATEIVLFIIGIIVLFLLIICTIYYVHDRHNDLKTRYKNAINSVNTLKKTTIELREKTKELEEGGGDYSEQPEKPPVAFTTPHSATIEELEGGRLRKCSCNDDMQETAINNERKASTSSIYLAGSDQNILDSNDCDVTMPTPIQPIHEKQNVQTQTFHAGQV